MLRALKCVHADALLFRCMTDSSSTADRIDARYIAGVEHVQLDAFVDGVQGRQVSCASAAGSGLLSLRSRTCTGTRQIGHPPEGRERHHSRRHLRWNLCQHSRVTTVAGAASCMGPGRRRWRGISPRQIAQILSSGGETRASGGDGSVTLSQEVSSSPLRSRALSQRSGSSLIVIAIFDANALTSGSSVASSSWISSGMSSGMSPSFEHAVAVGHRRCTKSHVL